MPIQIKLLLAKDITNMIPPAKDNPKLAHPILLVLLSIENLLASLSGDARKVNHNFDTQVKNSYPLAKRLEVEHGTQREIKRGSNQVSSGNGN